RTRTSIDCPGTALIELDQVSASAGETWYSSRVPTTPRAGDPTTHPARIASTPALDRPLKWIPRMFSLLGLAAGANRLVLSRFPTAGSRARLRQARIRPALSRAAGPASRAFPIPLCLLTSSIRLSPNRLEHS